MTKVASSMDLTDTLEMEKNRRKREEEEARRQEELISLLWVSNYWTPFYRDVGIRVKRRRHTFLTP